MYTRWVWAVGLALPITGVLLVSMSTVVATGNDGRRASPGQRSVSLVQIPEPPAPPVRARRAERPPSPAIRPGAAPLSLLEHGGLQLELVAIQPRLVPGALATDGLMASGDMNFLPVRIEPPDYPPAAIARGLDGRVVLEFTVTESGTVRDVSIVRSAAPPLDAAAIRATLKYQFRPRVVGGVAIETTGVQNTIVFQLEDQPKQLAASL